VRGEACRLVDDDKASARRRPGVLRHRGLFRLADAIGVGIAGR
jgi:hypothetical protein